MLPSCILTPLLRLCGLIVMVIGIICISRTGIFPMDWMLQSIWFLSGLALGIAGFLILIYTPWLSDYE